MESQKWHVQGPCESNSYGIRSANKSFASQKLQLQKIISQFMPLTVVKTNEMQKKSL